MAEAKRYTRYKGKERQKFSFYMESGTLDTFRDVCKSNGLMISTVVVEFIKQIINGDLVFCVGNGRLEFYYKDKLTDKEILWKDVMGE